MYVNSISDRLVVALMGFGEMQDGNDILNMHTIQEGLDSLQSDHQWRVEIGSPFLQVDLIQDGKISETKKGWSAGLAIGEIWIDTKVGPDGWDLDLIHHE